MSYHYLHIPASFLRRKGRVGIFTLLLLLVSACSVRQSAPAVSPLEDALAQAGGNRAELEKVLRRYSLRPEDSLKYRAACFLIENMPGYGGYEGSQLDDYLIYYKLLAETRGIEPAVLADSVTRRYGAFRSDSLRWRADILTVDSAFLCRNIELAFKVWREQPWGKHVGFADFCEYILPYRVGNERLTPWREAVYREFNPLLDSLRTLAMSGNDDPAVAARVVLDSIRGGRVVFTTTSPADLPHVGFDVARLKAGSCREFTDFTVYVCRALGIPCAVDFMPVRGENNDGHQWVSFPDKYGGVFFEEFPRSVKEARRSLMYTTPKLKVYRTTFSLNRRMQADMQRLDTTVVPLFRHPRFKDVPFPMPATSSRSFACPGTSFMEAGPVRPLPTFVPAGAWVGSRWRGWRSLGRQTATADSLRYEEVPVGTLLLLRNHTRGAQERIFVMEEGRQVWK